MTITSTSLNDVSVLASAFVAYPLLEVGRCINFVKIFVRLDLVRRNCAVIPERFSLDQINMSIIISIWSADRRRKHVCLFKEAENIIEKVKGKFGLAGDDVTLVLERDGSVVDPDFELLSHLSALKETVVVLAPGETWTSSVVEVGSSQQDDTESSSTSADFAVQSPSGSKCLPLPLTPTGNQTSGLGPFAGVVAFRQFVMEHPNARTAASDLVSGNVTINTRQQLVKLAKHKLLSMFGNYPNKGHLIHASVVLGELLDMPSTVFYDPKSYDGFLARALQNFRKQLPVSERKFTWSRKRKPSGQVGLSVIYQRSDVAETGSEDGSHQCPRRVDDCSLCIGKDADAERDRFKLLSVQRFEDMKSAALSTFCRRRSWIAVDKPLLTDVLRDYPKFQSTPQLLDLEFATLLPDANDFLIEFPAVMEQLWKYCQHSKIPAVRQIVLEGANLDLEWKAWYAVKALFFLLRPSTKKRISGAEALPNLIRIVPIGSSLETEIQQLSSYSPALIIQGEVGGAVTSVKIAAETKLVEAGSTIAEGMDRLFKTFWIFNMAYPESCANVLKFIEVKAYNIKDNNKIPPTVRELCSFLSRYM